MSLILKEKKQSGQINSCSVIYRHLYDSVVNDWALFLLLIYQNFTFYNDSALFGCLFINNQLKLDYTVPSIDKCLRMEANHFDLSVIETQ